MVQATCIACAWGLPNLALWHTACACAIVASTAWWAVAVTAACLASSCCLGFNTHFGQLPTGKAKCGTSGVAAPTAIACHHKGAHCPTQPTVLGACRPGWGVGWHVHGKRTGPRWAQTPRHQNLAHPCRRLWGWGLPPPCALGWHCQQCRLAPRTFGGHPTTFCCWPFCHWGLHGVVHGGAGKSLNHAAQQVGHPAAGHRQLARPPPGWPECSPNTRPSAPTCTCAGLCCGRGPCRLVLRAPAQHTGVGGVCTPPQSPRVRGCCRC